MHTHRLSETRWRILGVTSAYQDEFDRPPTLREIQERVGSLSGASHVKYHFDALAEAGYIRNRPGTARGVEVIADGPARASMRVIGIPIEGVIAAGEPIMAAEAPTQMYITGDVARRGDFALRVKGHSMIEDHIEDGDIVVVRAQETADDSDTVVALLVHGPGDPAGEVTLKRFYHHGPVGPDGRQWFRLQPQNETMEAMWGDQDHLRIQGVVVSIIRRYA